MSPQSSCSYTQSHSRAVVFDLDDTLYPEMEFVISGFKAVAQHLQQVLDGGRDFFGVIQETFDAGARGNVFNLALERMGLQYDHHLIANLVATYRAHKPILTPFAGAINLLETLRGRFYLGILTDGPSPTQRNKVQALGIAAYFDCTLYTGDFGDHWSKPSPLLFQEMQRCFHLPGTRCAYIADNPAKDFYAPNHLGWLTIRVRAEEGLYSNAEASRDYRADVEIRSLDQVLPILERWRGN